MVSWKAGAFEMWWEIEDPICFLTWPLRPRWKIDSCWSERKGPSLPLCLLGCLVGD